MHTTKFDQNHARYKEEKNDWILWVMVVIAAAWFIHEFPVQQLLQWLQLN